MASYILETEHDTCILAQKLASTITPGSLIFLSGNLGTGKTTLVRYLLHAWGYNGLIKSPTFTLVEPYLFNTHEIYHFDLYRLKTPEELDDIGFRDYCTPQSICLIEWPEKAEGYLPKPDFHITLTQEENRRRLTLSPDKIAAIC